MKYFQETDVRFRDLDALAHVNNVVYLTYVEQARIGYFNTVIGTRHDWNKWGVLLARTEINYLKPIVLNDRVVVGLECVGIGNKSLEISFKIFVKKDGDEMEEVASGMNVLVCFDHVIHKSIPVPVEWKTAIEQFEDGYTPENQP